MPTPAEWVCVRRVRVKDGIEAIWWLSKTPHPRADNRAVLWPYSDSYRQRLANPRRDTRLCPSGHPTELRTLSDRGGAIPPQPDSRSAQRQQQPNTSSTVASKVSNRIRPGFPRRLPEYFIRLCTQAGDTVVDPFAGSCVTGESASGCAVGGYAVSWKTTTYMALEAGSRAESETAPKRRRITRYRTRPIHGLR